MHIEFTKIIEGIILYRMKIVALQYYHNYLVGIIRKYMILYCSQSFCMYGCVFAHVCMLWVKFILGLMCFELVSIFYLPFFQIMVMNT